MSATRFNDATSKTKHFLKTHKTCIMLGSLATTGLAVQHIVIRDMKEFMVKKDVYHEYLNPVENFENIEN